MPNNVDAVIAALRIAQEEAEKNSDDNDYGYWNVMTANRWIDQLPGAWMGRWRHLKLDGDSAGEVELEQFIGHVRATLAYLEANRDAIQSVRFWSLPFTRGGQRKAPESSGKPIRLIKR